jgi:hypothetical protein
MLRILQFFEIRTHSRYLTNLHAWKEELSVEATEDDDGDADNGIHCISQDGSPDYLPSVLPHNYDRECIFLGQMKECLMEIYYALQFRWEVIKHLYPNAHVEDSYMHPP